MDEVSQTFKVIGGPNDGETVRLSAYWNGRAHAPQPVIQLNPREEMPLSPPGGIPMTATYMPATYYRWVWQDGNKVWFDYRINPPT